MVGNSWLTLRGASPEEIVALRGMLTINYRTFQYNRKGRKPESVARQYFMFTKRGAPTGMLREILDEFPNAVIKDFRGCQKACLEAYRDLKPGFPRPLWDHQSGALAACLNVGRGVVAHATGSGKTVTFSTLIYALKQTSLVIVPNITLLTQTWNVLAGFFGEKNVGIVGGDRSEPRYGSMEPKPITVATPVKFINTCMRNGKPLIDYGLIILDEAHHVNLSKFQDTTLWYKILMASDAYYRFGFTATPGNPGSPSGQLLRAATGRIIHEVGASALIQKDLLCPAEIRVYEVNHGDPIPDWRQAHDTYILGHQRNVLIARLVNAERREGRSVLIVVGRVDQHGRILQDLIPESVFLWGGTDAEARRREMLEFDRKGGVLVGTIFGEGVDLPRLDTVILASGGKSDRQVIQRVGRALRRDGDNPNKVARIIDFFDDDRGMLRKHSRIRLSVYEREPAFRVRRYDEQGVETTIT